MDESSLFHDQLLATKFFIPSSSHALIPRPRLIELLNQSLECPLTLVSAPAGFGKTLLLSTWVISLPPEHPRIAWISLDTQRRWYRYHALFAQALFHWLEQTKPTLIPILHHRASHWYAQQGRLNEAISHAITAQQWQWTTGLIEQVYALIWGNSEHAMLRRWLEKLPIEVMRSRPRLCLHTETIVAFHSGFF